MTNSNSGDHLDQIENPLEQFIAASVADRQISNERKRLSKLKPEES